MGFHSEKVMSDLNKGGPCKPLKPLHPTDEDEKNYTESCPKAEQESDP